MKLGIIILLALLFVVCAAGANAWTYYSNCSANVTSDMSIYGDTQLGPGCVYNLTDAEHDGAIRLENPVGTLDCNGSTIVGNNEVNSRAISINGKLGYAVKNCHFTNWSYAVYNYGSGNKNNVTDSTFINCNYAILSYCSNATFKNNVINNGSFSLASTVGNGHL
jgi:hypothetical protein